MKILQIIKTILLLFKKKKFEKKVQFRDVSINFKLIVFISLIIVIISTYIYFKSLSKTLLISSNLLSIFSIYLVFSYLSFFKEYIDELFLKEKEETNKKRKELLKAKNSINKIIVINSEGIEYEIIDIKKEKYLVGKKTTSNFVDIDLSNLKYMEIVSRLHIEIYKKEDKWYVIDKGSKNGTKLLKSNNRKINLSPLVEERIMVGDVIELCKFIKLLIN